MNENDIKRKVNDMQRKAQENSKLDHCLICKKKITSFCNSHSLPQFVLKKIASNGMIYNSNIFFGLSVLKNEKGVNNSGTFKRICKDCDKNMFKDYEDERKIVIPSRKKMMTQIDLKNTLRMYDKRLNEIALYKLISSNTDNENALFNIFQRQIVNNMDLVEIKNEFKRDIDILNKSSSSSFELIYWKKLDYVTPIAFQGHIALQGDLCGDVINDLYNPNSSYVIENINICVFPLASETIVMMFVSNDNKKYRRFIKQFKKLKEEEQLHLISFIIVNYSEDFFIAKDVSNDFLNNEILKMFTRNVTDIVSFDEEMQRVFKNTKLLELMNYKDIPNILSKDYALNCEQH